MGPIPHVTLNCHQHVAPISLSGGSSLKGLYSISAARPEDWIRTLHYTNSLLKAKTTFGNI